MFKQESTFYLRYAWGLIVTEKTHVSEMTPPAPDTKLFVNYRSKPIPADQLGTDRNTYIHMADHHIKGIGHSKQSALFYGVFVMKEYMSGKDLYCYLHIFKGKIKYLLENEYIAIGSFTGC